MDIMFLFTQKKLHVNVDASHVKKSFITTDHTIANFLRRSPRLNEEIKRGTHPVDVEYTWIKDAIVLKYVMSELPNYDKEWVDISYIYMPYNIERSHYILIVLNMVEGRIMRHCHIEAQSASNTMATTSRLGCTTTNGLE
ncbi:uncharacterized protein E5676_scaffold648G001290 [Cucumis melo var. makuwa]|nr:uncharacterized protein E5676_scaffold648G001290 [Cucumis melo var. makuwa]